MSNPEIGEMVWFFPAKHQPYREEAPLAAIVAGKTEKGLSLAVFAPTGKQVPHTYTEVCFVDKGVEHPNTSYCRAVGDNYIRPEPKRAPAKPARDFPKADPQKIEEKKEAAAKK